LIFRRLWLKDLGDLVCRKRLWDLKTPRGFILSHRQWHLHSIWRGTPQFWDIRTGYLLSYSYASKLFSDVWKYRRRVESSSMIYGRVHEKGSSDMSSDETLGNAKVKMVYRPTGCYQCDDVIVSMLDIQAILKSYMFWKVFSTGFAVLSFLFNKLPFCIYDIFIFIKYRPTCIFFELSTWKNTVDVILLLWRCFPAQITSEYEEIPPPSWIQRSS